jgi:hypothetical protein
MAFCRWAFQPFVLSNPAKHEKAPLTFQKFWCCLSLGNHSFYLVMEPKSRMTSRQAKLRFFSHIFFKSCVEGAIGPGGL